MCGSAAARALPIQVHTDVEVAAHQPELGQIGDVIVGKVHRRGFTTLAGFASLAAFAAVLGELEGRRGGSGHGGFVEDAGMRHPRRQRQRGAGQHYRAKPGPHLDAAARLGHALVSPPMELFHR